MKIVWFSWKDSQHPLAGGAEAVSTQLMSHLVKDGHQVKLITARYTGSSLEQTLNGVEIYRTGNRFSVYPKAARLFRRQLSDWPDLIIDEMNTIPFGCALYSRKRSVLYTYQLARKVWFHQMPFPISLIGYLLEPVYLWVLSRFYRTVLTESDSTRKDLQRFGFKPNAIHVVRVGSELQPLAKLPNKPASQQLLVLGAIRPMKQTLEAVKAFELARDNNDQLSLVIAGDDSDNYAERLKTYVGKSRHNQAIQILGRVSKERKTSLMQKSAIILVTSIKEGWGLIITEANGQGTPAIAYDNDGLRDSIQNGQTGILTAPKPAALADAINNLLNNPAKLDQLRINAHQYSQQFTYQNSYADFTKHLAIKPSKATRV
ncbi:MAG: glycosyltransferase family 4 protein [Candidatus Saccharimonadales bacterium]